MSLNNVSKRNIQNVKNPGTPHAPGFFLGTKREHVHYVNVILKRHAYNYIELFRIGIQNHCATERNRKCIGNCNLLAG